MDSDAALVSAAGWRFLIDRGGTFTDLVGHSPDGRLVVRKVLSEQPDQPGDPAIRALRQTLGLTAAQPLPSGLVEEVRLGTTVATNALLERKVEPVLLLLNHGFADLPRIGDQHRSDIFALKIERPDPLPVRVIEVGGRLAADGREVEPLRLGAELETALRQAATDGYRSCAVALLHSYREPAHELVLGEWLERLGFTPVLLSHRVSDQPRLVPRIHTTVAEAALRPVLLAYLARTQEALGTGTRLRVMTSSGALRAPELLQAKDTILSGPAGGMVGAVAAARAAGFGALPILGFDMGGTSTDVFHWQLDEAAAGGGDGFERSRETEIGGLRLQAPMLPIHTVAAGGGSVLHLNGERLQVGPHSAGADPGPACYRRGGPLTITDANLLLGRLPADALPPVFGPSGDQPADAGVVRRRFEELARGLGAGVSAEQAGQGAIAIAIERMAEAIRCISIQRGHDIRQAVLVTFGGAGGLHACPLAEALGIERVLLHPLAGVLSAWGIGLARQSLLRERSLRSPLCTALLELLETCRRELTQEGETALRNAGDLPRGRRALCRVRLELRYGGSESGLEVSWPCTAAAPPVSLRTEPPPGEPLPGDLSPVDGPGSEQVLAELRAGFEAAHRRRFGYVVEGDGLVVERLLVELTAPSDAPAPSAAWSPGDPPTATTFPPASAAAPPERRVPLCLPEAGAAQGSAGLRMGWQQVPLLQRDRLAIGQRLEGPAVVVETTGTTVLEPGWSARVLEGGELLLERLPTNESSQVPAAMSAPVSAAVPAAQIASPVATPTPTPMASPFTPLTTPVAMLACDPVQLELYNHRFTAIAEQMGVRLQQSSRSVNIRERLDFSCALFDAGGRLVANAPHIPVHLGSMGESVVSLLAAVAGGALPPLGPGDAVASNNPFNGGTHLPDITVITPVFAPGSPVPEAGAGGEAGPPLFFVACRGHHADVGGITPGSMPPFSRSIAEEGLLLDNVPLLLEGRFDAPSWQRRLAAGRHPVRDPEGLLADLQAQLAANRLGVAELQRLIAQHGSQEVRTYMAHVQSNAADAVRRVIDGLHDGSHTVELDDGALIRVAVRINRAARRACVDFTGTSPQQPGNGNAPLAITKAVVLYVFRCLVGRSIPLNAGCFDPIDLVVPPGSLLHPEPPAAVVAGNVETSQAVANALFAALGVMAAAQGTMNNLSFGNNRYQYYETICGGTGAGVLPGGEGFAGASAVQSHMTNSRLTDPEILEDRFPVRLERFALRGGSGGAGRWRGGDGVVRCLRFLEPMQAAILSGSRRVAPFGLAGGEPGSTGRNRITRADGRQEPLAGFAEVQMEPGDLLCIETPGGGGFGAGGGDPQEEP